jgi:putative adhesin
MRVMRKTTVLAVSLFLVAVASQAADTKEFHKTVPLAKDGRVSVETYKGSVTVTTWDRPEVRIDARIEPDGTESDQREKVALTEVRVSGSEGSVTIQSDYDRVRHRHFLGIFGWNEGTLPFVRYNIQMPASARLEIEDHKSEIKVADLKADLKLHTYKGTAAVAGLDGGARVKTYKGDVRVEFTRFSRDSRFETYKGEIMVQLPKDGRFDLDADSGRRGSIDSDFAMTTRASRSSSARLSGAVNGGGPQLRMTTYKGALRVRAS